MGTQRQTQFPFDAALQLDDGATAHAAGATFGQVAGANMVFDIMAGAPGLGSPPNPDTVRYGANVVVDVLSITGSDVITLEGATDAAFTTPVTLATMNATTTGQYNAAFTNASGATQLRYLRLKHTVTTGPVNAIGFLAPWNAQGGF